MKPLLVVLALAAPLVAEQPFRRHNLNLALGAGLPRGDLKPFLSDSFGLNLGYGYRFHQNFQADIGLDTVFHAARVRDFYESRFGDLRIRDFQYLLPFGARAILPAASGRLQVYGGGGGAYIRYQESIRQPFGDAYVRVECPVCQYRSGWGYYGMVGASVALDRRGHFRLGFNSRVYRAHTSGDRFGSLPFSRTRDAWINAFAEFGVSF